jgi:hypothetical protein
VVLILLVVELMDGVESKENHDSTLVLSLKTWEVSLGLSLEKTNPDFLAEPLDKTHLQKCFRGHFDVSNKNTVVVENDLSYLRLNIQKRSRRPTAAPTMNRIRTTKVWWVDGGDHAQYMLGKLNMTGVVLLESNTVFEVAKSISFLVRNRHRMLPDALVAIPLSVQSTVVDKLISELGLIHTIRSNPLDCGKPPWFDSFPFSSSSFSDSSSSLAVVEKVKMFSQLNPAQLRCSSSGIRTMLDGPTLECATCDRNVCLRFQNKKSTCSWFASSSACGFISNKNNNNNHT